jgi:hypothetical protein
MCGCYDRKSDRQKRCLSWFDRLALIRGFTVGLCRWFYFLNRDCWIVVFEDLLYVSDQLIKAEVDAD